MSAPAEQIERFPCFGGSCAVLVSGADGVCSASEAALDARRSLLDWHRRFSRFLPDSELSMLNEEPRREVPASRLLVRLAASVRPAGELSGGLVDATLAEEIEIAGYAEDLGEPLSPALALALAPARKPARSAAGRWREVHVDARAGLIVRPPGLRIDGGGLAKGLFADLLAERLSRHDAFAVDCAGDLALGGAAGLVRPIHVECPFRGQTLHTFELIDACVATSGITRRSWLDHAGRPAHHLLDPATGAPAFTGIVQVTALAPSALEAEVRAKAALLAGPQAAHGHLPHGGAVVYDDGSHRVFEPQRIVTVARLSGFAGAGAQVERNRAASSEPPVASPSL
ncbi:MAG TPA: FAD:protein FMN transferase [Solirubrobacteraceae bacterium]|jgi:thiamine biosynthesis lipoprotein|nr:FAD:protein FMN transferase [Solirubrobacteraceae bacterium]